jgi:hypothetical protein
MRKIDEIIDVNGKHSEDDPATLETRLNDA